MNPLYLIETDHGSDVALSVDGDRVRVLATSGLKRSRFLPDVPTFQEQGYPDLFATERFGVYLTRGSSPQTIQRVNEAVNAALRQDAFRATLEKLSYEPLATTPEEFEAILQAERARWGRVIQSSGFTAN